MESKDVKWTLDVLEKRLKRVAQVAAEKQRSPIPYGSPSGFKLTECSQAVLDVMRSSLEWKDKFNAQHIILRGYWPPVYEMESIKILSDLLEDCVTLSISKNMIEKISGLKTLKNLRVLSLAQNQIKSLSGLEHASNTLEELIIAWNMISQVDVLSAMTNLVKLDISFNHIRDLTEYGKLKFCPSIRDLTFEGNPVCKNFPGNIWREMALQRLPQLDFLDNIPTRPGSTIILNEHTQQFCVKYQH